MCRQCLSSVDKVWRGEVLLLHLGLKLSPVWFWEAVEEEEGKMEHKQIVNERKRSEERKKKKEKEDSRQQQEQTTSSVSSTVSDATVFESNEAYECEIELEEQRERRVKEVVWHSADQLGCLLFQLEKAHPMLKHNTDDEIASETKAGSEYAVGGEYAFDIPLKAEESERRRLMCLMDAFFVFVLLSYLPEEHTLKPAHQQSLLPAASPVVSQCAQNVQYAQYTQSEHSEKLPHATNSHQQPNLSFVACALPEFSYDADENGEVLSEEWNMDQKKRIKKLTEEREERKKRDVLRKRMGFGLGNGESRGGSKGGMLTGAAAKKERAEERERAERKEQCVFEDAPPQPKQNVFVFDMKKKRMMKCAMETYCLFASMKEKLNSKSSHEHDII